jgi:hypothetical protein
MSENRLWPCELRARVKIETAASSLAVVAQSLEMRRGRTPYDLAFYPWASYRRESGLMVPSTTLAKAIPTCATWA